jgi:two-component system, LytTR family, response regulator
MKAVIIDDEEHCIVTLRWNLEQYCKDISVVAVANNGLQGLEIIQIHKPDIVFLDIEMPIMNGLDMLDKIPEVGFKLIFTTAYNHYAVKAIKLSAVDYLMKPIDKDELIDAIEKVRHSMVYNQQHLQVLKHNLNTVSTLQKILVATTEGILFFDISSIIHLDAQSNYTMIYLENGIKQLSSKTLKDYEEILPLELFFRCHNSHIINLQKIDKYFRGEGGIAQMKNGREIEISRRKKAEFLEKIGL